MDFAANRQPTAALPSHQAGQQQAVVNFFMPVIVAAPSHKENKLSKQTMAGLNALVSTSLHEFWCTKRAKRRLAGGKSCKSSSVPSWVPQTPNPLNPTNPKRYIETPHPITSGVFGSWGVARLLFQMTLRKVNVQAGRV